MKMTIGRITRTAMLAVAFMLCATGGAWAAASLEETGGYITTERQLAFKNATLYDVKDHLTARMAGGWITNDGAEAKVFNYDLIEGQRMTCEAQIDGEYADNSEMLKSVVLLFEAFEGDVYVTASGAKYKVKGTDQLGTSIASSGTNAELATSISASGYGLYYLGLDNRTNRSSATVLWESDFETAKVSADGYTYSISDLKGNTIDGGGNIAIASGNNHYGVLMTLPDQSKTKMSVLIKYKGLAAYTTANSGLFSFKTADNKVYGFRSTDKGQLKLTGFNESESSHWPPTPEEAITLVTRTGVYLVSTDTSVGISGYTGKGISALEGATVQPYAGGSTISSITLGGSHNTNKIHAWDGVTIEKVAIFMGESYGPSDLADFVFPSDATSIPSDSNLHTVNVNFTHSSTGVSTESNLGLVGIPGTKWNNMAGANGAQSDIKVANLAGDSICSYPELAVKVSGSRGSWECSSLTAASDLRRGYIDDNSSYTTPTITAGVPFEKYRVIVYHATDTGNAKFGYVTINGNNLCYDSDNWLRNGSGSTSWGDTGGSNTALAMEEGKNVLVSDVYTAKPLKIIGHRDREGTSRGCLAAFQIVKVEEASITADGIYTLSDLFNTVGANSDFVINVKESATLNIASATTVGSIEFNVDEGKTLTLTGFTLTAAVGIRITGKGVVSTSVLAQLSGTLKGDGILAYTLSNGASNLPSGLTWTRSAWRGTVWLKDNKSLQNFDPASYGNSGSTVRLTGMKGYFPNSTTSCEATVELVDDGETVAFEQDNAYNYIYTFKKVKGSGTFKVSGSQTSAHNIVMEDVSEFTGTLTVGRRTVALGAAPLSWPGVEGGTIYVASGTTATIENAKIWTAKNITVDGILKIIGSGRLSASGTVTCKGAKIDLSEAAKNPDSAVVNGALVIDASTTIDFPADATFPYTLATSLSGADSLSASSYTIGGCEGTSVLGLYSDSYSSKAWAYPPTSAEFSGGTVAWASLGWSPSYGALANNMYYAECSISVKESGTITLPSTKVAKLTIDVPEGKTLTLGGTIYADEINFTGAGKVVCLQDSALSGMPECTIKGDEGITIEYPNKKLPLDSVKWIDEDWKGTLVITNCGLQNTLEETGRSKHGSIAFDTYGNRYSKIKAPGFKGHSAADRADAYCSAELVIDEGTTFEFNHGDESLVTTPNAGFRFRKLSGSGTLRLDGTSDTAQYIFEDVASFTGIVEITNPNPDEEVGGKKSFILGAPTDWEIFGSDYPANLVIAGAVTVPGGVFWDTPAGVVILSGGTLTVGAGSSISGIDSKSLGTLSVAAGDKPGTVVELKQYAAGKAEITANLSIPEGATLKICDTNSTTRLTVPADSSAGGTYSNAGMLDLSACTSLTELHLKLGDANSFDFTRIQLPSPVPTIVYDIGSVRDLAGYNLQTDVGAGTNYYYYATETAEEYANGGFVVSNVTGNAELWLIRQNGALIHTAVSNENNVAYRYYAGGRSFAGAACWHEWDFEQVALDDRLKDTGRFSTNEVDSAQLISLTATVQMTDYTVDYFDVQGEDKRCLSSAVHPSAELPLPGGLGSIWSAAVRCTMPSEANKVAIAFGDTTSGVVGLASGGQTDVVEMFNWTNGVYTTLARLQVESATSAMHIYVFTVTNGMVSLYRDGEFIHKAEFALNSDIQTFKVGNVTGNGSNLPGAATDGYVDYVRLYDKVLPEADIEGLSLRRPFISDYETYLRDINGIEYWSQPGEWVSKTNETLTVATPTAGTHVTVNVEYESTLQVNLTPETAARYGTLIFKGSAPVTIAPTADNKGRVSADMVVVRTPTIIRGPGVVDFSTSIVGVDEGASLAFDFSDYPFAPTQEVIKLTGPVIAREYDATVDNRIIATRKPSHTWTVSDPYTFTEDPTSPNYLSYFVTISPTRTIGTDAIYYQGGYLTSGMEGDAAKDTGVFSDDTFTQPTILLEGDKVVISDTSALGEKNEAWISDQFNGNIHVTRTMLNLMPGEDNDGILSNRTVTVDSGKTLNFKAYNGRTFDFGALTLNGSGTINFADNATAASLSGNAGITVADGKTLTLGSADSFVSGTVSGTGTVKLPAVTGSVNFNTFGGVDSIVALTGGTSATMTDVAVTSTLRLDGPVTIEPTESGAHSFAKITGVGDLTFSSDNEPSSITINNIENYTGSLNNDSSTEVTVSRITLPVDVAGGTLLLATNGVGSVIVSSVWFAGEESASGMPIAYADGGVYKAVAQFGGNYYATFEDAIAAATDSGLGTITVLEESASLLPSGYYFVPRSSPVQIAKYPVAVVKDGVVYSYTRNGIVVNCYYGSIMEALIAIFSVPALNPEVEGGSYDYIEVLSGGSYGLPLGLVSPIKIKNSVGEAATFSATGIYEDTELSPTDRGTYTEYGIGNRAVTYTWTGAAMTVGSQWDEEKEDYVLVDVADPLWTSAANWSYVNSSSEVVAASRYPQEGDRVAFYVDATVTLASNVTVVEVTLGEGVALTLNAASETTPKLTTTAAIQLSRGQTITLGTGVTLDPEPPTTTVEGAKVFLDGNTYKVVYGTIFSVY